jgi:N-acetylglutamate synthase-like GNAT family acetyltransferase
MNYSFLIRNAGVEDILIIQEIAYKVWPDVYTSILPDGQVDYMLRLIYSVDSLKDQMQHLQHHFLILEQDGIAVGFASYSREKDRLFKLNKLYVLTQLQRNGLGEMLLARVVADARKLDANALMLTVNRNNLNAKLFYEKRGFIVSRELKMDIGEGYFMDDLIMELKLE